MSLKEQASAWVQSVAAAHLGANVRRYTISSYVGEVRTNMLGGIGYLRAQEGKVVAITDQFTLVKVSAGKLCVFLNALLSQPVEVGTKARFDGYQLRRFDGTLADGTDDASVGGFHSVAIGVTSMFPVTWPGRYLCINEKFAGGYRFIQNPYLRDLITQMESTKVNAGVRRVVNVLIDANASDLDFNDPPEEQSAVSAPSIKARVATSKFTGAVEVFYTRSDDMYGLRLKSDAGGEEVIFDIPFTDLGDALLSAIDDETWALAKVTVLKAAPKKRVPATA